MNNQNAGETIKQRIDISGMSCGHCVSAVRSALDGLAGIDVDDVSIGSATIAYATNRNFAEVRREVEKVLAEEGYVLTDVNAESRLHRP